LPDAASRRPVAASHGVPRRSEDSNPQDQDGYWFPSDPGAFRRPWGGRPADLDARPKPNSGPPCAFVPLQRHVPAAPHRSVGGRSEDQPHDLARDAASPGVMCPTTQSRTGGSAYMGVDPSTTACHVRGLATSFAASTTGPTGARGAGASMGFALQGFPLVARGTPLGALALLTLPPTPPPKGVECARPPTGPRSRDESVLPPNPPKGKRPSMPSWASPLQSFPPIRPGDRL
jgi:hypothetical protein